jgi:hypothetical protein
MPDDAIPQPDSQTHEEDPGASTEMFRAFVEEEATDVAPSQPVSTKALAIVAAVIVVIAVVAAIAVF